MKLITLLIILLLMMYSCDRQPPVNQITEVDELEQKQIDSILNTFKFEYEKPVSIDSTDHIYIPISTYATKRKRSYSGNDYSKPNPRYWNVAFYNVTTEETRLLTEEKLWINSLSDNYVDHQGALKNKMLYTIINTDYNKNGILSPRDPQQLFISHIDGTGLKRISPINEDLISYSIIDTTSVILLKTKRDSNADLDFNGDDEVIWYKLDLNTDLKPIEMIDSITRKKIKNLYFEQWIIKK